MKKCKHLNCQVNERFIAVWIYDFKNGVVTASIGYEACEATGEIEVICEECGFRKSYTGKGRPKWVSALMNAIVNRSAVNEPNPESP